MTCPTGKDGLNRIGNDGEGGKMICTELLKGTEDCVVFSLGSNGAVFLISSFFILIGMNLLQLIMYGE